MPQKPGWKVVLQKEARARWELVADTSDMFITTTVETVGLIPPEVIPSRPQTSSLIRAVELSVEDNLLAQVRYNTSLTFKCWNL